MNSGGKNFEFNSFANKSKLGSEIGGAKMLDFDFKRSI